MNLNLDSIMAFCAIFAAGFAHGTSSAQGDVWIAREGLAARTQTRTVWDSVRGRVVAFGGIGALTGTTDARTLEWDGVSWALRTPETAPPPRQGLGLVFDSARSEVVMFGGLTSTPASAGDTWIWDGHDWQLRTGSAPAQRSFHAMAFDPVRSRVVMFGGRVQGGSGNASETWEWDGSTWLQRSPATVPPGRENHAMAWDSASGRVLMFGGVGTGSTFLNDTWAWDGNDWAQLQPNNVPPAGASPQIAADPVRQRIVLHTNFHVQPVSSTWEWNGVDWREVVVTTAPAIDLSASIAYDGVNARVILAFGSRGGTPLAQTWSFDGFDWRLTDTPPSFFPMPSIVFDASRGRAVMLAYGTGLPVRVWEWAGKRWDPVFTTTSPNSRSAEALAYDPTARRVIAFGGYDGTRFLAEQWEWDGVDWTQRTLGSAPPPRGLASMVFDQARGRMVLFSGLNGGVWSNDTWEWDGFVWQQRFPANSPSPANQGYMTYDTARSRVVFMNSTPLQTWEWDGIDWTRVLTAAVPPFAAPLTFDIRRSRVVLSASDGFWEYDGVDWMRVSSALDSSPKGIVFDETRQRLLFVARDGARTWLRGPTSAASVAVRGLGCAGTAGVPTLSARGLPHLSNDEFRFELGSGRSGAVGAVLFSPILIGSTTTPCSIFVGGSHVAFGVALDANGFAESALPIPNSAGLIGLTFSTQGVVLDPQGLLGLVALTNGIVLNLGD